MASSNKKNEKKIWNFEIYGKIRNKFVEYFENFTVFFYDNISLFWYE